MAMRLRVLIFAGLLALAAPALGSEVVGALTPQALGDIFPSAERVGPADGVPPAAPVYSGGDLVGFVFSTRAVVQSTGYSGKPLDILVGLGLNGRVTGARLIEHHEPILVIGVPDEKLTEFVARFRDVDIRETVRVGETEGFDAISGATVSSIVISDSILRSARIVARAKGIIAEPAGAGADVDIDSFTALTWPGLLAAGVVQRLTLSNAEVAGRFEVAPGAAPGVAPEGRFLELYAALLTPATSGRNLLGDRLHNRLMADRPPGAQYIFLAADGRWSFKGTEWVRSGVFERVQIVQGATTFRLTKAQHRRLSKIHAQGTPEFREAALFTLPPEPALDPARPWRVELLVTQPGPDAQPRQVMFALTYQLPATLRKITPAPAFTGTEDLFDTAVRAATGSLWLDIWKSRIGRIAVLIWALVVLTAILFLQDVIARRPWLHRPLRYGFLVFTLLWLGWYAGAQLSVINVLTFAQALLTEFHWELFLLEPLIFILWAYVALAMLFWGRGVYCGWLCPFGALQELLNHIARAIRVPQIIMPFGLHERLWPIKYIAFLVLFAISLGSMTMAVVGAEIEPFKTVLTLGLQRAWPFTLYALVLLGIGLFIERFFCRYLCPLGGALAIPARLRMFDWLKRRPECGAICQHCAVDCTVQAIHPDGRINPNECIHCLNCQVLFYDDRKCPPLIERRKRRERRHALSSEDFLPEEETPK